MTVRNYIYYGYGIFFFYVLNCILPAIRIGNWPHTVSQNTNEIRETIEQNLRFFFISILETDAIEVQESYTEESSQDFENKSTNSDWPLFDQIRSQDIKLLKTLNVGTIVDFMVEKKKVKFGLK